MLAEIDHYIHFQAVISSAMPSTGYAIRKANRSSEVGAPERAYTEMRRELEHHLQRVPPQTGRFVAVVASEERLREALTQRATIQQVLDVMEQRWPYTAQRMALVLQIAGAVGTEELHSILYNIQARHGLVRPAPAPAPPLVPAPPSDPSSVDVQPSLSTAPSLPPPRYSPPARLGAVAVGSVEEQRETAIRNLSSLTRGQWHDLAYELSLTVGCVEDLERASGSGRESVRRMLTEYFNTPRLHRGDQFGTLIRAVRGLNLNMTADRLEESLGW